MQKALTGRLMRIKHDHRDLGFMRAEVVFDDSSPLSWGLHVESPADVDEFRDHLVAGKSMTLTLITRAGEQFLGEAAVASVSSTADVAAFVTLCGIGPLQPA